MRSSFTAAVLCTLGLSLAGCAAESASEEGALEGDVGATNEAVAATGQSTFYRVVRQDFRKCAWPLCGGVYVARVNRTESLCADGKWASECYVAEFDWKALGLADSATFDAKVRAGSALVRGKIESRTTGPVTASTFVASEGWEARIEGATATGYFSRLTQRAVKCASPACVSFDLSYLNLSTSRPVNTFATKALPTDLVPELNAALADGKIGVLVAGDTYLSAGRRTFVPSQVYTQPKVGGVDGARCGGRGTGPCADGYFCSWSAGANCGRADASGTCTKRAEICTEIYKPVCGCDGKTYGNACAAASAGVSVETAGACGGAAGATCGGLLGKGCQDGLFCDYPIGTMCGATDMTGICTEPTTICTKEYAPVCGCDGKTYGNACMARSASVSAVSKGACK